MCLYCYTFYVPSFIYQWFAFHGLGVQYASGLTCLYCFTLCIPSQAWRVAQQGCWQVAPLKRGRLAGPAANLVGCRLCHTTKIKIRSANGQITSSIMDWRQCYHKKKQQHSYPYSNGLWGLDTVKWYSYLKKQRQQGWIEGHEHQVVCNESQTGKVTDSLKSINSSQSTNTDHQSAHNRVESDCGTKGCHSLCYFMNSFFLRSGKRHSSYWNTLSSHLIVTLLQSQFKSRWFLHIMYLGMLLHCLEFALEFFRLRFNDFWLCSPISTEQDGVTSWRG